MGLRDITIAKETVVVGKDKSGKDQSFEVRGLSYEDIVSVLSRHESEAKQLFEIVSSEADEGGLSQDMVREIAKQALHKFPKLVSDCVALAADEPEEAGKVGQLPFTVQVDAIDKMLGLTFRSEAELKKLVETVLRGLSAVTVAVQGLNSSRSALGSGESDAG